MSLTPQTGSYTVGEEFTVTVNLDSAGEQVVSADARLSFDPSLLQARSVIGSLDGFSYVESIDNTNGVVTLSAILSDIFSDGMVVNGEFAVVTFTTQAAGTAAVDLVYDPQDQRQDSSVATLNGDGDQLTGVSGASYTLTGAAAIEPTATPMPQPTSTPAAIQPTSTPTPQPTSANSIGTLSTNPTNTPTPTVNVASTASELPNTSTAYITYILTGMATALLLMGARLAVVRA